MSDITLTSPTEDTAFGDPNNIRTVTDVDIADISLLSASGSGTGQSVSLNLMSFVDALSIFEDMFTNTLHGEILLTDAFNLPQNFPIVGRELLHIKFRTPGDGVPYIDKYFSIYKLSPRIQTGEASQAYSIKFVSQELMESQKQRISQSFKGKAEQIINTIFAKYLKIENDRTSELVVGPTHNQMQFIIPNWEPLYAINWIAARATDKRNPEECNFLFFQTLEDFRFQSISELCKEDPKETYIYYPNNVRDDLFRKNLDRQFHTIRSFCITDTTDKLEQMTHGMFSSSLAIHDIVHKRWSFHIFDYIAQFDKMDHLERAPLIPKQDTLYALNPKSRMKLLTKHTGLYNEYGDTRNFDQWVLQRASLLEQIKAIKININIPGNSTLRVGDVISIELPANESLGFANDKVFYDKQLSGKYLVTCIHHFLKHNHYQMQVEICRDSLRERLPDQVSIGK